MHLEFESPITVEQGRAAWRDAPGIAIVDRREDGGSITPLEAAGKDDTHVSRLRRDQTVPHGLAFRFLSDNLRKGAALNAIQIAEEMHRQELLAERLA